MRATPPRWYREPSPTGSDEPGILTASSTGRFSTWRGPLGLTRTNSRASAPGGPAGAALLTASPIRSPSRPTTSTVIGRRGFSARVAGVVSRLSLPARSGSRQTSPSTMDPSRAPIRKSPPVTRFSFFGRGSRGHCNPRRLSLPEAPRLRPVSRLRLEAWEDGWESLRGGMEPVKASWYPL